jgi:hypothetical protein
MPAPVSTARVGPEGDVSVSEIVDRRGVGGDGTAPLRRDGPVPAGRCGHATRGECVGAPSF